MEIIKNKKKILTTILLLFAISGLCNIVNVSADTVNLPPLYYLTRGRELKSQEGLKIFVSSSGAINVYIMDSSQYEHLKAFGGLSWLYLKRWKDISHLEYTYTVPYDDVFYVIVYNTNILYGRTVEVNIEVIPYFNVGIVGILLFSIGAIMGLVVIVASASRYKRKKKEAEIIQVQEGVKPKTSFCSNCGAESIGITSEYCPKCGSKV